MYPCDIGYAPRKLSKYIKIRRLLCRWLLEA
jgi:hypothetical protein